MEEVRFNNGVFISEGESFKCPEAIKQIRISEISNMAKVMFALRKAFGPSLSPTNIKNEIKDGVLNVPDFIPTEIAEGILKLISTGAKVEIIQPETITSGEHFKFGMQWHLG